jgi:hypothetical protein
MTTTLTEQRTAAPGRFDRFDGTYEVGPGGTKIEHLTTAIHARELPRSE